MTMTKEHLANAACIINPGAAQKKWSRRRRLKKILARDLPGQRFDALTTKENMIELVRKISPGFSTIIALGGDGTIADVLQGIRKAGREKDVLLGIIPLGSGNAFRKSLNIPKNVRRALRVIQEGEPRLVSLMEIEGRIAGFSSIGATAGASDEKLREKVKGFWGHALAGLGLLSQPLWDVEVELQDGIDEKGARFERKAMKLKILDCVVAKSNYFGYSFRIAPMASLEDEYLDITFFEMSGWRYALLLPLTYFGLSQRRLKNFKAKKLVLTGKELPVQYHGEYLGTRNRVEVEVIPQAIRVIAPKRA
ncbi:MAG: diacylglycerol kinase catalytic region [Candidatus Aminicenantes bacterium]|jgi:diacylglycerol kinase family enzyme|nr:diacylglycerol kinase catalytic region [Candidatus Aminicenantes bacterium]